MTYDGNNFNAMIDGELRSRLYRLLNDVDLLDGSITGETIERFSIAHEEIFGYRPFSSEIARPGHMLIATIAGIYAELVEVARPHRRSDVGDRAHEAELFELQEKLDNEENEWRASLDLPPVNINTE